MKNILLTIFTTVGTLLLAVFLVWNFVPFSWLEYLTLPQERILGAALTTINATDKISSLPTTLNANFDALNAGSIDVATTSMESLASTTNLVAVGTLTTGTWNASTLTVSYGGTGSTTLSAFQLLMGSSTNGIDVVPGFGTTGQFLTSNGENAPPTWQTSAVDQTLAYLWTGIHNFTGNTYIKNLFASSTITIGDSVTTKAWVFPVLDKASSSVLATDGSGTLEFISQSLVLIEATTTVNDMKWASSTASLSGYESIHMEIEVAGFSGATVPVLHFNGDNGANYGSENFRFNKGTSYEQVSDGSEFQLSNSSNSTTSPAYITVDIDNQTSDRKYAQARVQYSDTAARTSDTYMSSGVWNNTSSEITSVAFATTGEYETNKISAGTRIRIYGRR